MQQEFFNKNESRPRTTYIWKLQKLDQYNSLFEKLSPDDFYIIKQ